MLKILGIFFVFCLVCIYTDLMNPAFHSSTNLENLVERLGLFGCLSIGVAFVIICGGIDLSIGSVVGLSGTLLPWLMKENMPWSDAPMPIWQAVSATVVISALIGLTHGLLITLIRLQPFVVTLCGLLCYRGLSRWLTDDNIQRFSSEHKDLRQVAVGKPFLMADVALWFGSVLAGVLLLRFVLAMRPSVRGATRPLPTLIGSMAAASLACGGYWIQHAGPFEEKGHLIALSQLEAPMPFLIMMGLAVLATIFLTNMTWGRYLYAIGRNEQAARYSGIGTKKITVLAYVLCSLLAGIGGMLFALENNAVEPDRQGNFYELYAIAAAVLGGCSLRGGEGIIIGVLIGTAVMRVLNNCIILLDIPPQLEFAIIGGVILIGVIADEVFKMIGGAMRARFSSPSRPG